MNNYYITFMQYCSLRQYYVKVQGLNESEARVKAFNSFGEKWAFIYSEEKFLPQIEQFNLLKFYGNVTSIIFEDRVIGWTLYLPEELKDLASIRFPDQLVMPSKYLDEELFKQLSFKKIVIPNE